MFPLAIPLITSGIQLLGGLLGNRKTGAEKGLESSVKEQSALAREMAKFGKGQMSMANPAMSKAMQHYMTLLQGNRGAMDAALAPERGQIAEAARGAQMGMDAKMAPGPQRDAALAELQRQKFGQMAMLPFQARNSAAGQVGALGSDLLGKGNALMGSSASALGNMGNQYGQLAQAQQGRNQAWGQIGSNIYDIFSNYFKNKGK